MELQRIYIPYSALEEVLVFPEHYPCLYNVLLNYSEVILDLTSEALTERSLNDPILKTILEARHGNVIALKSFFDSINDQDFSVLAKDIIISNQDEMEIKEIADSNGILIISGKKLNDLQCLQTRFGKSFSKNDSIKNDQLQGWRALVPSKIMSPCNSIIINDNNLFANNLRTFIKEGISIVGELLDTIAPDHLSIPLQVMVLTNNGQGKILKQHLQEITKNIETIFSKSRTYPLDLSLVTHTSSMIFHERCILTNFHYLKSDYGFNIFNGSIATRNNSISIDGSFSVFEPSMGDPKAKRIASFLQDVSSIIRTIRKNNLTDPTQCLIGSGRNYLLPD